ncbi:MAG: transcription termination/antitermination protein NusA [Alphaproteobacteria bacterium]|nr:transcription termination/antitermination protein NusA [Alphaproteobacteria bacterium]
MQNATLPRPELIQMADVLAHEKGIDKLAVLHAMEEGISKAGRTKYGPEYDIRTHIDPTDGSIEMVRVLTIVENVDDEFKQISLAEARKNNKFAKLGEEIIDALPPMDFGRIAALTARQVIMQKVRDAERNQQYEAMKDKKGQIVHGLVKRVEAGNLIVEVGHVETLLRRDELIPRESYRVGDRIRALVLDVRPEIKGPQVFLTRSHPDFVTALFKAEVPEVYDGSIEIKAVSRDAGSRSKIAVYASDSTIDARGACIGMRGIRVQAVTAELQGEKIDVVTWSADPATFIINALAPNEVLKIVIDEDSKSVEVVMNEDQLSLAIGRRGQNIRLVSQLTGWHIDMMTEAQEAEHRQNETKERVELFMSALDIDDMMAHLLIQEGFASVEDIAYIALEELTDIEGFDEGLATELQNRAKAYLVAKEAQIAERLKELNLAKDLTEFEGMTNELLVKLGDKGIKCLDDLADLAGDELMEIAGDMTEKQANEMIMKAREHWFSEETQSQK